MKKYSILLASLALCFAVVGCGNKNKTAKNDSGNNLTDVAPPAPAHQGVAYQPAPYQPAAYQQPTQVTPVNYEPIAPEPVVTSTPATSGASKKYTVQKGDTLWGIAQRTYGDGKQYRKIVQANPTIKGERVLAGQTIVLP